MPCKPTKSNGGRLRNLPKHEPEKWKLFKEYCVQDVVTEKEIKKVLDKVTFPEDEQKLWELDMKMNAFRCKDRQKFSTRCFENIKY